MNFRLIATELRQSSNGVMYDHTVWIGEFDSQLYEEEEAIEFVKTKFGPKYRIQIEDFPTVLH